MATTTPDGLVSPDTTDPVNFVADWAATTSSVQTALSNRATRRGTTAERTAATGVREGTLWSDTTLGNLWVYIAGSWAQASPQNSGTQTATGVITATGGASLTSIRATRVGNLATIQGVVTGTFSPPSTQFGNVTAAWQPAITSVGAARFSNTGYRNGSVRLLTTGGIFLWMEGSGSQGGAEFSVTYVVP